MLKKTFLAVLIILMFSGLAFSASVGTAPGFLDMGEIEPGETIEETIYITTNFDDTFVIRPELRAGPITAMFRETNEMRHETSEKDISEWIEVQEQAEIDPNETTTHRLEDGSAVRANGKFDFEIRAPPNAEPGYHYGSFNLNPEIQAEGDGAGSVNWGETRPNFRFRVSGYAERDIQVTNIEGIRIGENRVQLIKQIRNSGTVTTRLRSGTADIVNENNEKVGEIRTSRATLEPGEIAEIDNTWNSEEVEGGSYSVEGTASYRTGETYISGDFVVTDIIRERQTVEEPSGGEVEETGGVPFTLILIFMVVLGVLLYLFELNFLWLVLFAGFSGIILFVLFSAASNYLILILLATTTLMLYYGGT